MFVSSMRQSIIIVYIANAVAGGHILWLGEVRRSSPPPPQFWYYKQLLCLLVGLVLVPQIFFYFVGLLFFPSPYWPLCFLSLFFSLPPTLLDSCANASLWYGIRAWTHFLAIMEWADDIGSRPATWSYVPVQSSSCSLRVFYRTLVVGKDTY